MMFEMYCVKDVCTGFLTPMIEQNQASAVRNFEHAVRREDTLFFSHASDYALYKVGEFNSDTGIITGLSDPQFIISADSIVR